MLDKDKVLQIITDHSAQLHQRGVSYLALFGSVARGEALDKSDVDFLVEFNHPVGLFRLIEVKQYLQSILDIDKVDLVMPDSLRPEFRDRVMREAIRAA